MTIPRQRQTARIQQRDSKRSDKRVRAVAHVPVQLEVRTKDDTPDLPPGVCGRVQGIALTYNVRDAYGTMFAPGCLARTRAEKLAAGKVKLLADHMGYTDCHVGVVRSLDDVADAVLMSADFFDTEEGRAKLAYVKAVTAAKAFTGLSIGFYDRASETRPSDPWQTPWGSTRDTVLVYTEIELDEVSLTPSPAVPGAEVLAARREAIGDKRDLLRVALGTIADALGDDEVRALLEDRESARDGTADGNASEEDSDDAAEGAPAGAEGDSRDAEAEDSRSATGEGGETPDAPPQDPPTDTATMDERLRAVRRSFAA